MNRRTRFLIGLVLLATMTVSLAETVWAAACGPDMGSAAGSAMAMASTEPVDGTGAMEGMEHAKDMQGMEGMPPDHDCMPGHVHDSQHEGGKGMPCPFAPAGAAQGCAASACLPSSVALLTSPSGTDAVLPPSDDAGKHLFRSASIFHPPKP